MAFYPFTGGLTSALRGTGTSALVGVGTTGDTANRAELDADGGLRFGTGAGAVDTVVSRGGPGQVNFGGNVVTSGSVQINSGGLGVTAGVVDVKTAGNGLMVAEGANAKQGTAVLVAGTVTVANTSVTANSRIAVWRSTAGGTLGHLSTTQTAGVGFTVTSSSATDTSTIGFQIFEPG